MKRKLVAMLLTLCLLFNVAVPYGAYAADDVAVQADVVMAGSGTADDPYVVTSEAELKTIPAGSTYHYILGNNIELTSWTTPIGTFKGVFDGNGYTITISGTSNAALFKNAVVNAPATIKNLRVVANGLTVSNRASGILAYETQKWLIENCAVIGNLTATNCATGAGAIIGNSNHTDGKVNNCYVAVEITGGTYTGALVGWLYAGSVTNSYYDKTLYSGTGVGVTGSNKTAVTAETDPATGKITDEMKSQAFVELLNANKGDGLTWKYVEGAYPDFAEHKTILSGAVSISGTTEVGQILTADDTFVTDKTKTYTWYRVDTNGETVIDGATASTYTLTDADKNYYIKVKVDVPGTLGGTRTATTTGVVKSANQATLTFTLAPTDAKVVVLNSNGTVVGSGQTSYELSKGETYTYFVGKDGYTPVSNTATLNDDLTLNLTLTAKTLSGFSSEENYNMQVGKLSELTNFPTGKEATVLKWAAPTGTSFTNAEPTNAVFAGGNLFVAGKTPDESKIKLKKIDTETGAVLASTELAYGTGWNFFLTTAENMLFIMEGTRVQALDTDLTSLWVSEELPGNQGLCPINYADGFVYGGTCASADAGFFCLSAADGKLVWFNKSAGQSSESNNYLGSYWAGGCIIGDYVVYGTGGGYVYAADKLSGEIKSSQRVATQKDIRSSVVYDGTGYIYFTSVDANVHKAAFNAATGDIGTLQSVAIGGSECTATPALDVTNKRLYVGSSSQFAVFNTDDMSKVASEVHNYSMLRDMRLVVGDDATYAFTTYYKSPGSVVVFKFNHADKQVTKWDFSSLMSADMKQFCASMPIFGPDGTIYASNDRGYLAAYTKAGVMLDTLSASVGTLDFNNARGTNELVVPIGTDSVELTMTAAEGVTITVGETPVTDGKYTANLTGGAATVKITVAKGATMVYTLNIRQQNSNNDISVVTSDSNDIEDNVAKISAYTGTDDVFVVENATSDTRIWLGAKDSNAKLGVPAYLQGSTVYEVAESSNVYNDVAHKGMLFSFNATYPLVVKTAVTAESGAAKNYYVVALIGAYNGTDTYCLDVALNKSEAVLNGIGATETLTATTKHIGTTAPMVTWTSSAPEVATVDENGKVTVVSEGTTIITAAVGKVSATCTVITKPTRTVYVTYTKGGYVTGKDGTELYKVAVEVADLDRNGKFTVAEALKAFHTQYCTAGADGYGESDGYINKFWGDDTYNVSYMLNDKNHDSEDQNFTTAQELTNGDRLNVFYYQDTAWSDLYTYFDSQTANATVNSAKEFTVNGYAVMSELAAAPKGATVKVYDANGTEQTALATTVNENGKFTITFPATGNYTVEVSGTASYTGTTWDYEQNTSVPADYPAATVVPSRLAVTVSTASSGGGGGGGSTSTDISVKFRLIGSTQSANGVDMDNAASDAEYVTWIATKTYTLPKGSTDLDLFDMALEKAGLSYDIESNGWLNSITAPASQGGYVLGNMDNGDYSGWMYTLNNTHVQATLGGNKLKNGDSFIVHYINDYRYEDKEWATGSKGNSSTWNLWLKAKDVDPTGTVSDSTGGSGTVVATEVTPVVNVNENGEAKASLTTSEIRVIVDEAKAAGAGEIVVAPKLTGEASKVVVTIPAGSAKVIGKDAEAELTIKTGMADITLGADDLAKLGSAGLLSVSAEKQADGSVTISVTASDKNISLGNATVTVPGEGNVLVLVKADGSEEVIKKCVTGEDGITAVIDGGCTVKVAAVDVVFMDTINHWGKQAAEFVAARGIFNGTAANAFAPNDKMNRAMVATVLYRLENEPTNNGKLTFKDSIDDWAKNGVIWAAEQNIVGGDENGKFNGGAAVTRQELAAMLYRYAKATGLNTTTTASLTGFADSEQVADWASDAIKWTVGNGLIKGDENGNINPNGTATRAEVATVIMRLIEMIAR